MLVQRLGDQLLAGARFAGDQHAQMGVGQAADAAKQRLQRWSLTDQGVVVGRRRCFVGGGFGLLQSTGDAVEHQVQIKGFGQIIEGALLVGAYRAVEVRVGGHNDYRQAGVGGL